jgi:hypothetical protein
MKIFKNRTLVIVLGIILGLAVLIGGWLFFVNKSNSVGEDDGFIDEQVVEKIDASEIGLTMEAKSDKKAVKFMIEKADGITSIEYQVTYEANSTAAEQSEGGEPRVQRGITGESVIEGGSSFESEWLDLGSCSKNVCRYDTGVESVTLTLKIVKDDGKVYEVEQTLEL